MRIIGGKWRGTKLADIGEGDREAHLRPSSDRLRETLFNILTAEKYRHFVQNARVLDVFAGTGALGLEALSRGANTATFIENGKIAQGILRENVSRLKMASEVKIIRADATKLPKNPSDGYNLVFLDPPYGRGLGERAMEGLLEHEYVAQNALIIWEEAKAPKLPPALNLVDQRNIGQSVLTIAQHKHTDSK